VALFIDIFAEGKFSGAIWQLLLLKVVNPQEIGKFGECDFASV
jgi:hypothetical protein